MTQEKLIITIKCIDNKLHSFSGSIEYDNYLKRDVALANLILSLVDIAVENKILKVIQINTIEIN